MTETLRKLPKLPLAQIWNMSMGFLGIQFGFALQNANASRILQTFGADVHHLSWFWLAAPVTGMIVQPIVGHYSDKTWTKLGRRRPFFLVGAILTAIALVLMPNAGAFASVIPAMFIGAGFLMIMDASINLTMEPFRALVGDLLPSEQHTLGFSIQSFLIGIGAVIGSWLPYILAEWVGVEKMASDGGVPLNVKYSFYIGAAMLLISIFWTIIGTKEYPPTEESLAQLKAEKSSSKSGFAHIVSDIKSMPKVMKELGIVQFFTWLSLFGMWVYTTPAIASHVFGATDPSSPEYNDAGNWVGVIFGVYNGIAALFALALPSIAKRVGRKMTHAFCLSAGGIGLLSIYFITDKNMLLLSMVGVGIAWSSILAMPYAILADVLPKEKMGFYMGLFNFYITLPQVLNGLFMGLIVKHFFNNDSLVALMVAGFGLLLAALSLKFVHHEEPESA